MTDPTATMHPNSSHPRIIIALKMLGKELWPTEATAHLTGDDDRRDWFGLLCLAWPAEPGYYWRRDSQNHATVRPL